MVPARDKPFCGWVVSPHSWCSQVIIGKGRGAVSATYPGRGTVRVCTEIRVANVFYPAGDPRFAVAKKCSNGYVIDWPYDHLSWYRSGVWNGTQPGWWYRFSIANGSDYRHTINGVFDGVRCTDAYC